MVPVPRAPIRLVKARLAAASVVSLTAWVLATSPARGEALTRAPEGHWQGIFSGAIRLVLHVERDAAGVLRGTLDSPDQGAMGLPIDRVSFQGDSLRCVLVQPPASYRARLSADGKRLAGLWSQGGVEAPLDFERLERAPQSRRPQEPKPPYPYRTEDVTYENVKDGVTLAGTLTTPSSGGPFPVAILITGSGPENRDELVYGHRPFLVLADHLTRKGIAVLRVDDRGVGGSTGSQLTATSDDFAHDVLAGVSFLKGRKEIDGKRIGLIGHSEGGTIAPIAATRSKDVAWIVLLAGTGIPGDSLLLLQNAALLRSGGAGDSVVAAHLGALRRIFTLMRQDADDAALLGAVRQQVQIQLASVPPEQRRILASTDSLAAGAFALYRLPWMHFFVTFDPRPVLAQVRVPVLALAGGRDVQVTPSENQGAIRAALEQGGNRDATVKELPGLNHLFQRCSTCTLAEYAQLEETIAPVALEEISRWIAARTRRAR